MKSNRIYFGVAGLIAMTALASCSTTEAPENATDNNVISLSSSLNTRTATDPQGTQLNTSNTVGVYVMNGETAIANGSNNEHAVLSNGSLTTTNTMTYPKGEGASVDIYAYAPYSEDMVLNEANAISVSADQSNDAGYLASDLVYASKKGQQKSAEAVKLNFSHKMSQLQINIVNAGNYDLNNAQVYVTGTKLAATFNPYTNELGEATGEATDIKAINALGEGLKAYAIIMPQTIEAATELVKIITAEKVFVATISQNVEFESGLAYSFSVRLEEAKVDMTLEGNDITEWGDPTDLGESSTEGEEQEVEPMYATFGTPGGSASYDAETFTYTWQASSNNLMNCFSFDNGELAKYTTLNFNVEDYTEGGYRINILFSDNSNKDVKSFYSGGKKELALSELDLNGHSLSEATAIRIGGTGSVPEPYSIVIKASEMYLK